jgi:hypothetical protein
MSIQQLNAPSFLTVTAAVLIQARQTYIHAKKDSTEKALAAIRWHSLFMAAISAAKKSGVDALRELNELIDPVSGEHICPPGAIHGSLNNEIENARKEWAGMMFSQPACAD